MKTTKTRTVAGALLLGLALTANSAVPALAAPRPVAADTRHDVGCDGYGVDGTAMAAAIGGLPNDDATSAQVRVTTAEGCWAGTSGVADLRGNAPVPPHARFRIGSVTKVFTATVVLQLAAEHRVDLNAPVQRYLPGLLPRDYPAVTVRQLLDHTSGLPSPSVGGDIDWALAHRYDRWTPAQLVRLALANPKEFEPGERQHYTNIGYIVAGMLIEKVTGHSYAAEIQQRIAGPLGLRDTYSPGDDPSIRGPHVHGYQAVTRDDGTTELVDATTWSQTFTPAAGNLVSSLADLDTFAAALFGGRLLPAAQLDEMFTVPPVDDVAGGPAHYSVGLTEYPLPNGETIWIKTGSRYGYLAGIAGSRDGTFRVAYSVTGTDAKGGDQSPVTQRIAAAAIGMR